MQVAYILHHGLLVSNTCTDFQIKSSKTARVASCKWHTHTSRLFLVDWTRLIHSKPNLKYEICQIYDWHTHIRTRSQDWPSSTELIFRVTVQTLSVVLPFRIWFRSDQTKDQEIGWITAIICCLRGLMLEMWGIFRNKEEGLYMHKYKIQKKILIYSR